MQHIAVLTSVPFSPDDPDWSTTAAGRKYSYKCWWLIARFVQTDEQMATARLMPVDLSNWQGPSSWSSHKHGLIRPQYSSLPMRSLDFKDQLLRTQMTESSDRTTTEMASKRTQIRLSPVQAATSHPRGSSPPTKSRRRCWMKPIWRRWNM